MNTQLESTLEQYESSEYCERHLRPFLTFLSRRHKRQGGVTELRIAAPDTDQAAFVGYFKPRDATAAIEALSPAPVTDAEPDGHPRIGNAVVAYNPHPVSPARYASNPARFTALGDPSSETDLVAYSMFAVRAEPVRRDGAPPTMNDLGRAKPVVVAVSKFLEDRGIRSIPIDGGDSLQLLVPTRPYADVARALANDQALAQLLDQRFSTKHVKVTSEAPIPGRAWPLPGTLLTLGAPHLDRPYRFVLFLRPDRIPDDVDLFGLLEKEIAAFQTEDKEPPSPAVTAPATQAVENGPSAGWDAAAAGNVLAGVLERSGLVFRTKQRDGERLYALRECPHADGRDGRRYGCRLVVRPDGTFASECRHDTAWKDFKSVIGWEEHARAVIKALGIAPRSSPYRAKPSGLFHFFRCGKKTERMRLTNFVARIVGDVEEDDGFDTRRTFQIEATLDGRTTRFSVPAAQFRSMNWALDHLGAKAVLFPGAKAHAPPAIQTLSGQVVVQKVYKHTGWTEIDGRPVYLHAAGGIGQDGPVPGVRVELPGPLALYRLPAPPAGDDLRKAVQASLKVLEVAPDQVTVPAYAAVWRVAVGATDFSNHLVGPSGTGKSEFAALLQQHAGAELDARHLPANWLSTANANEMLAFLAKDALLVVDDFVPAGGRSDASRQHREADRLFRGQGNSAGRGRLRSDVTLQSPMPPRGSLFSTGEVTPRGQSVQARLMILEWSPDAMNWERLTAAQQEAAEGLYAAAFAGFVRWLAARLDEVRREMPKRLAALREQATASGQHKRTPGIVANLYFGLELFSRFTVEARAVSEKEAEAFRQRCWKALGEVAEAQAALQLHAEPAQHFLELLRAALSGGHAHVAGADGNAPAGAAGLGWRENGDGWTPTGECIGWADGTDDVYLEPEAAYAVAQRMAQDGREPLGVGAKTLHKRLHERGHLASTEEARGRLTVRRTL